MRNRRQFVLFFWENASLLCLGMLIWVIFWSQNAFTLKQENPKHYNPTRSALSFQYQDFSFLTGRVDFLSCQAEAKLLLWFQRNKKTHFRCNKHCKPIATWYMSLLKVHAGINPNVRLPTILWLPESIVAMKDIVYQQISNVLLSPEMIRFLDFT